MRRTEAGVGRSRCGAAGLRERHRLERGGEHPVRDRIVFSLQKMEKAIDIGEARLSLEKRYGRMLLQLPNS